MDPAHVVQLEALAETLGISVTDVVDQLLDFAMANPGAVFDWRPAVSAAVREASTPDYVAK